MSKPTKTIEANEAEQREQRIELVRTAKRPGRPPAQEIAPWSGIDPDTARMLAELFPAPNPDMVVTRRLRRAYGGGKRFCTVLTIPVEVLYVAGFRPGDTLLMSAWADGVVRIIRLPEGQ